MFSRERQGRTSSSETGGTSENDQISLILIYIDKIDL